MPVLPDANTVFGGATGQHLFLGIGAQLGVQHGQAAAAGIRPIPGTLERHFARWSAAAPERVAALVDRQPPGAPVWEVLDGYLKRHPTCGLLHGVNDAVEELAAGGIGAAEVAEVQVRTYLAASTFDEPAPRTDLAARFSIPWTVAAGLTFGVLDHRAFTESALHDKDLLTLAARVQVLHDPDLDAGYPAGRPSSVTVRFGDGRCLRAHSDRPRGDGATAGTDPRIRVKPLALLSRVTDTDWAERLLSTIARLDTVGAADLGTELCVPVRETKCG
jgi:2-methylcitrate dehydratase PrpD